MGISKRYVDANNIIPNYHPNVLTVVSVTFSLMIQAMRVSLVLTL